MRLRLARTAGFCMGVKRAMELTFSTTHDEPGPIYTYGPLIHNPQVLELLAQKGVEVLDHIPPADSQAGGTVIIRAHGVPPEAKKALKAAGFQRVVDGTCPRVIKVQAIIQRATKHGQDVVIVGEEDHPEVVGLKACGRGRAWVVGDADQVADLPGLGSVVVVAQTTQSEELFNRVVRALQGRFDQVQIYNTICEATRKRQDEVARLAQEVDGVVVVGGRDSGNTRRLAAIAGGSGKPAFHVETEQELDHKALAGLGVVGVTAGASTPNWMIKRVLQEISNIRPDRPGTSFWLRRLVRLLVRTQLWVAGGGAAVTLAACLIQGIAPHPALIGAAMGYIYAMHVLNHFLDKEACQYNDPDRAQFLHGHRHLLVGMGVGAALGSLALSLWLGPWPLAVLTVLSVLGLLYSVPVLPRTWERRLGVGRLKDIPGSKTLSAAAAWAVVTVVVPALTRPGWDHSLPLCFGAVLVLVFVRSALFDILDAQGDLIVGKETIPIVLGESQTSWLLQALLGGLALVLVATPALGLADHLTWGLLPAVAWLWLMKRALTKGWITPGPWSDALVDFNFWLAGAGVLVGWGLGA